MLFSKPPSTLFRYTDIRKLFREFHPFIENPSIEHCVPRSVYKDNPRLGRDMHNLICLPRHLNSHRSNYKLVNFKKSEQWKCLEQGAKKNTKKQFFVPPSAFKGMYARSIGYFFLVNPTYQDQIQRFVLDPELLLQWDSEHPPSSTEMRLHDRISHLQENENPLLVKSTRDDALHEISLTDQRHM